MQSRKLEGQSGYILLIVPIIIIGIILLGYRMISRAQTSMHIAADDLDYLKIKLCSQQCVALAANRIQYAMESNLKVMPGKINCNCKTDDEPTTECKTTISSVEEKSSQACYGYQFKLSQVELSSKCSGGKSLTAKLSEVVGYGEIPIFQFAIFYDGRLKITNAPPMNVLGLVHSNDSILIGPEAKTTFSDWVTSPKPILAWDRLFGTGNGSISFAMMSGTGPDPVSILPANPTLLTLDKIVGSWSNWKKLHRIAFAGQANGCGEVQSLKIPIKNLIDPVEIIEWRMNSDNAHRRKQKFSWKSTLIYKDGWLDQNLQKVDFIQDPRKAPVTPIGWDTELINGVNRVVIYDGRESHLSKLIPIDVELLQKRSPSDSIVYLYDQLMDPLQKNENIGGFLLFNAQKLIQPLTIATNSSMMVLGNYNVDSNYVFLGKKYPYPAALINDNITILSMDILPDEHRTIQARGGSPIISRNPKARIDLNACIMTGNSFNVANGGYYGNHENLIRYLEDWDGATFGFSGSAVAIWNSKISIKPFLTKHYHAPDRDFSFSSMYLSLDNLPPGTPRLVVPGLLDWEQVRE